MTQDVTIPVELTVCVSKMNPSEKYGKPYIIEINRCQIIDMLTECQVKDIFNLFHLNNSKSSTLGYVDTKITFEVGLDGKEIDAVDLNGEGISDILSHEILDQLKAQAEADHIADLKDRGIKYKGGA